MSLHDEPDFDMATLRYVVLNEPNKDGHRFIIEIQWDNQADEPWHQFCVFGILGQGGATKEEVVYWAERAAEKNPFRIAPHPEFHDIAAALPKDQEAGS